MSVDTSSPGRELRSTSARRAHENWVRRRLGRLKGSDRDLIPAVEILLSALHAESAARRVALREAEREVRRLQALVSELDRDPQSDQADAP